MHGKGTAWHLFSLTHTGRKKGLESANSLNYFGEVALTEGRALMEHPHENDIKLQSIYRSTTVDTIDTNGERYPPAVEIRQTT